MKKIFLLTLCLHWIGVPPALANNAPGPLVALPWISILPLMLLFTKLGGGYAILNHAGKRQFGVLKVILVVIILFISAAFETHALWACILFGFISFIRGLKLYHWGIQARSKEDKPAQLEKAVPIRLIAAGTVLIVITVFLVGMAAAFFAVQPRRPKEIERNLSKFVAYQLAHARIQKAEIGQVGYNPQLSWHESSVREYLGYSQLINVRIEYGADHRSFEICVPPQTVFNKLPFFPYNFLTSFPTYYADETGQIRMSRTSLPHGCCPEDAPVVLRVAEEEILEAEDWIRWRRQAE